MAQLSSFATTASNVSTDAATRTITISAEVVEIDGLLDPPTGYSDWGGWTIRCQSSGGFRSTSGASGTLGGGSSALRIVEATNAHRFGGDNFSNNNGANARFAGDATNVLKYHNIIWIVESGGRSDFDIGRGTSSDGSAGCKVELSGVALYQQHASGGSGHFNHYSGQASIRIHDDVGYGLRIENRTNGPAIEFSTIIHTGSVVEGLVIANVTAANNNNGSRAAVRLENVANNGTMVLSNLNTPSIANVNAPNGQESRDATKTLVLIDPVGLPSRNDWSSRYHGNFEIRRNVPFSFTQADPDGATMHALAQTSGGQNATSTMSGASDTIQVRTNYSPHQDTASSTWTSYNTYRFFMTGLGFRKYSLTTTQTIANTPTTITAALTADALPDGTAISAITAPTNNNPPDTLSEVIRAIKDVEVANPVTTGYPTTSLAYIDGNAIKINTAFNLDLNSGNDSLIYVETDPNGFGGLHIDLHTGTSMSASNGLTTIDATGTGKVITLFSVTEDDDVFMLDSTGQKSVVNATNNMGATTRFALVNSTDGTTLASSNIANGNSANLLVSTKGLTTGYRLVSKRPGFTYFTADVDLTGGGLKEFSASSQPQIVQPDGSASYVTSVTVPDTLTVGVSNSGSTPASRVECGNATFSARQVFKAWEDEIASADGDKYMGLGGAQVTYTASSLKGNEIVLGAHTKVKRKATTDVNATIRATLYAPDDAPVDGVNGDVQTIEGLDEVALSEALWTYSARTLTSGGGGGGGATAQQIWEYSDRSLSTDPPTASEVATAVWESDLSIPATRAITPLSISDHMLISQADYDALPDAPVTGTFSSVSTYTGIDTTTTYYARRWLINSAYHIALYDTQAKAITNDLVDAELITGSGTASSVVFNTTYADAIGDASEILIDIHDHADEAPTAAQNAAAVWNASTRTLTTSAAPSASSVANAVWTRSSRTTTDAAPPSASSIATSVWGAGTRTLTSSSGGGFTSTDRTALTNMKSTIDALDVPTTEEIKDAIWNEDVMYRVIDTETFTPLFYESPGYLSVSATDAAKLPNGTKIKVGATGGYTGWSRDDEYYTNIQNNSIAFYTTSAAAIAGGNDHITFSGGVATSVRLVKEVVTENRNLGNAIDVLRDILLDTEALNTGVIPPSLQQIVDGVWSEEIEGTVGLRVFNGISRDGNGIVIPDANAAQIVEGDPIRVLNTGGFNWVGSDINYARVGVGDNDERILYIFDTFAGARNPADSPRPITGTGTPTSVQFQLQNARRMGEMGDILHRALANLEELTRGSDSHSDATAAIGVLINRLLGTDFVESGLSLQQAMQICTAILAGRLSVNENGTRFTFHRLDSGETAVIRSDVSDDGRTTPTRNPT